MTINDELNNAAKIGDWVKKTLVGGIQIDEIIRKVLAGQTIEINATIKFGPASKKTPLRRKKTAR